VQEEAFDVDVAVGAAVVAREPEAFERAN